MTAPGRPPRGSPAGYLRNLRHPAQAPGWKLRRLVINSLIRLRRGSTCCGHPGEPGC